MPEARRREVDAILKGLTPKHQRQLSVSTSNALERFSIIETVLQRRKLVLLLDYDGTLTPIVKDPSKALLSERVRAILRELPKHFITGVISGRSLKKIRSFVDVPGLFYAGSHGFDILAPSHHQGNAERWDRERSGTHSPPWPSSRRDGDRCRCDSNNNSPTINGHTLGEATGGDQGKTGEIVPNGKEVSLDGLGIHPSEAIGGGGDVLEEVRHQVAAEYLPVMATIRDELIEELKEIEGAEVEDNRFSMSIHYRNCARSDVPRVKDIVLAVQARHERIRMGSGKEVYELQPDIAWDKGKAVLWLLDKLVVPMVADGSVEASPIGVEENGADGTAVVTPPPVPPGDGVRVEGQGQQEGEKEDEDCGKFFTIFIGDDKTDENAFRALNGDMGPSKAAHDGIGILVSEESRETNAAYTLHNPQEVALFLEKIAKMGNERCCSGVR